MRTYSDEKGRTATGRTYKEAAVKLYGTPKDINGNNSVYCWVHSGYAVVYVYPEGAKVGTFYGVQAASPIKHRLKKVVDKQIQNKE